MAQEDSKTGFKPALVILIVIAIGIMVVAYSIIQSHFRAREINNQRDSNLQLQGASSNDAAPAAASVATPGPPQTLPSPQRSAVPGSLALTQGTPYSLNAVDQTKIKILNEILSSKNDNDKRLDTDFRQISPELKAALQARYQTTAPESRNERGTVAFLLCREISQASDVVFLASVLTEPPCLSMQNCSNRPGGPVDEHAAMANEVSIVYPQLVVIKCLEKFISNNGVADAPAKKAALEALQNAQNSDQPKVAAAATQALNDLKH